jgi:hypothetical protein
MKCPNSRKVCLAILALVVVGFLVDRLVLDSGATLPREAAASAKPAAVAPAPAPAAGAAEAVAGYPAVTDRLGAIAEARGLDPASVRDAFVPPEPWLSELTAPPPPPPPPVKAEPARDFARGHRLTSVLLAGEGGSAVVDGRFLRLGQEIDGHKLVRLTADAAFFQSGDECVELKLRPLPATP